MELESSPEIYWCEVPEDQNPREVYRSFGQKLLNPFGTVRNLLSDDENEVGLYQVGVHTEDGLSGHLIRHVLEVDDVGSRGNAFYGIQGAVGDRENALFMERYLERAVRRTMNDLSGSKTPEVPDLDEIPDYEANYYDIW